MRTQLIYLASPYSHKSKTVMRQRENDINNIGATLLNKGYFIYGPISMSAAIARSGKMGSGWDTWRELDLLMIDKCDEMWVVDMPGWLESTGVAAEIEHCLKTGKPVFVLSYDTIKNQDRVDLINYTYWHQINRDYKEYENGS